MIARRQSVPRAEADQPLDRGAKPLLGNLIGERAERGGGGGGSLGEGGEGGGAERGEQEQLLHGPARWTRGRRLASGAVAGRAGPGLRRNGRAAADRLGLGDRKSQRMFACSASSSPCSPPSPSCPPRSRR